MAGLGRKTFSVGEVLRAADVNQYLMDQSVMAFPNDTARGSAIGTAVSEGMVSYIADSDSVQVYDGTEWLPFDTKWTDYTPTLSNWSIGNGSVVGRYFRQGKTVFVKIEITIGSTTSFTNSATPITLPSGLNHNWGLTSNNNAPMGYGTFLDASTSLTYPIAVYHNSVTSVRMNVSLANGTYTSFTQLSSNGAPVTFATSDRIMLNINYETSS